MVPSQIPSQIKQKTESETLLIRVDHLELEGYFHRKVHCELFTGISDNVKQTI